MAKENTEKLSLLDQELDEASAKFLEESLNSWKEATAQQLMDEFEQVKQEKIEELEEENLSYREELKEEYAEKMLSALEELKESVRAEITASVLQNNPEIKILEQIKELVAPVINEDYRSNAYEDSILTLQTENEELKRQIELTEGAKTLATLVAGYDTPVRNLIVSLIKEGGPDEVTNQFYEILESLENVFNEKENDEESEEEPDGDEESEDDESEEEPEEDLGDGEEEGKEKKDAKKKKNKKDEEEEDPEKEESTEESYLNTGLDGLTEEVKKTNRLRDAIAGLARQ
jgi:hypothetical protein